MTTPKHPALVAASATCLVAGSILFALAGPVADLPWAPWLAPIFLLHWLRPGRPILRFLAMLVAMILCWFAANKSFLPLPGAAAFIASSLFVGYTSLAYAAHCLLAPRLPALPATLVLPAAGVLLEFLLGFQFTGTLFSFVYSQARFHPLAQIASVAGIWPIIFLILWFGSTVELAWHLRRTPRHATLPAAAFALSLAAVLVFGFLRLASAPGALTVPMAAITADAVPIGQAAYLADTGQPLDIPDNVDEASPQVIRMQLAINHFLLDPRSTRFAAVRVATQSVRDRLLAETARQAQSGARIIVWSEGAAMLLREEEPDFLAQTAALARQQQIYLFAALGTLHGGAAAFQGNDGKIENKVVVFSPAGTQLAVYYKTKLPPGDPSVPGNGVIPVLDTPYGRIATAICYDLDSPQFLRQVGRNHADLLLVPSGDWRAIARHHARAAWFRALENGVSILRPASHGFTLATGPLGVITLFTPSHGPIYAVSTRLPVHHQPTLYPSIGDSFVLLCAAALAALALTSIFTRPKAA